MPHSNIAGVAGIRPHKPVSVQQVPGAYDVALRLVGGVQLPAAEGERRPLRGGGGGRGRRRAQLAQRDR